MKKILLGIIIIGGILGVKANVNEDNLRNGLPDFSNAIIKIHKMIKIIKKMQDINMDYKNISDNVTLLGNYINTAINQGSDLLSSIDNLDTLNKPESLRWSKSDQIAINKTFTYFSNLYGRGIDQETSTNLKQKMDRLKTIYQSILNKLKSKFNISL